MKVGTKILLITLGSLACLVLAFFSVASVLLVENFDKLENTNATINTQQAKHLLDNDLQTLDSNSKAMPIGIRHTISRSGKIQTI